MNRLEAAALIKEGVLTEPMGQLWMDLGCGSGTFTLALATIIPGQSRIYAIDKNLTVMKELPKILGTTLIQNIKLDFISEELPQEMFDGILMANSLHYISEKSIFIKRVIDRLKLGGNLIIVEYEALYSNPMVPYPIKRAELEELLVYHGLIDFRILGEKQSKYGHLIYSLASTKK